MPSAGQLSLEYLLILAGFLAVFALLAPFLSTTYNLGVFSLDSANARAFCAKLQQKVDEIAFQADGAIASVKARPFSQWHVNCNSQKLVVSVLGNGKEKSFTVQFPNSIGKCNSILERETSFILRREKGVVSLEHNYP